MGTPSRNYLPVYLDLTGKHVLVVGGGRIAFEKVRNLLSCGAVITVVAKKFLPDFKSLKGLKLRMRAFREKDLDGPFLVIGATNDSGTNQRIYEGCERREKLVNIVDVRESCRFIFPAVIRRGDLLLAVSTGGKAPFLTKHLAKELRKIFDPSYETYVDLLAEARSFLKAKIQKEGDRKPYFAKMLSPRIRNWALRGETDRARKKLKEIVES